MQEVGYEDVFHPDEINEITDLYEKAHADIVDFEADQAQMTKLPSELNDKAAAKKPVDQSSESTLIDYKDKEPPKSLQLNEKYILRSHFDSVRAIHYAQDLKVLATISEDCMIKLWSMSDLDQKWVEAKGNPEPYLTLRGHTGAILCASGR